MASTVAMNVCATVTTASPGPTPAPINANRTASVPFATPTQYLLPQILGELTLEGLQFGPADELRRSNRIAERRDKLFFELAMGGDQIKEWDRLRRGHARPLRNMGSGEFRSA